MKKYPIYHIHIKIFVIISDLLFKASTTNTKSDLMHNNMINLPYIFHHKVCFLMKFHLPLQNKRTIYF